MINPKGVRTLASITPYTIKPGHYTHVPRIRDFVYISKHNYTLPTRYIHSRKSSNGLIRSDWSHWLLQYRSPRDAPFPFLLLLSLCWTSISTLSINYLENREHPIETRHRSAQIQWLIILYIRRSPVDSISLTVLHVITHRRYTKVNHAMGSIAHQLHQFGYVLSTIQLIMCAQIDSTLPKARWIRSFVNSLATAIRLLPNFRTTSTEIQTVLASRIQGKIRPDISLVSRCGIITIQLIRTAKLNPKAFTFYGA